MQGSVEDKDTVEKNEDNLQGTNLGNPLDIAVWGIEKFFDQKQCLRFFKKHFMTEEQFELTHICKPHNKPQFFVRFSTEAERQRFLNSPISKNRKIRVRSSNIDTSQQIYHTIEDLSAKTEPTTHQRVQATPQQLQQIRKTNIQNIVEPYHNMPYEKQVEQKKQALLKTIETYNTQFYKDNEVKQQIKILNKEYKPLELTEFVACSGKLTEYRNKTEFTIGFDGDGKVTVGFNKGSFQNGTIMLEDPRKVSICSKKTKIIAAVMEQFVKSRQDLPPFNRLDQTGFWRYLVVRQSERTNQVLVMIVVADKDCQPGKLQEVQQQLVQTFKKSIVGLKGLCYMSYNGHSDSIPIEAPQVLWGNGFYHEIILGTTFRVSSSAFLQGHTEMCQALYGKIIELVSECEVVLDLCCGIGTIGICIKNKMKGIKVIGVECCAEAVSDAKKNDQEYEVVLGKVQDTIKQITQKFRGQRIVGILDPPRAGVTKDVMVALRRCRGLDHIIYVSCSPPSIQDNLLQMTLPVTNKRKAPQFIITKMFGFDLFPQTKHFQALYYLERT